MNRIKKMLLLLWDDVAPFVAFVVVLGVFTALVLSALFGLGYIVSLTFGWDDVDKGVEAVAVSAVAAYGLVLVVTLMWKAVQSIQRAWRGSK